VYYSSVWFAVLEEEECSTDKYDVIVQEFDNIFYYADEF
jgi:hypothetical protein